MQIQRNTGYSEQQFSQIFLGSKGHLLKGNGPRKKMVFDNATKKYTDQLESLEIEVYFEGLGVQKVKLPKAFKLSVDINDLSPIDLINPEACVIDYEVYVRAKGIKEV